MDDRHGVGSPARVAPWPTMRGDAQNTGRGPAVHVPPDAPRYMAHCPTGATINATPVLGPGDRIFVGAADARFHVFDPQRGVGEGNPWSVVTTNIIDSAACFLDERRLYFASGDFTVLGIDPSAAASHAPALISLAEQPLWSPSPINWLEGNIVRMGQGHLLAGCDNFYMYCIDPSRAGAEAIRWATITGAFIWSSPALSPDESRLYFTSADCQLYALDTRDGAVTWTHAVGNLCTASPAYVNGVLVFGCFDGRIYGVRDHGDSSERVWEHPTGSLVYASAAVAADGKVFVPSGDGVLRALDVNAIEDGHPRLEWEFFLGMPAFSSAAIGADPEDPEGYLVYVGGGNGQVFAIDPEGRRRWSFDAATLEAHQDDRLDPAFWPEYRYPMINASVAAGQAGIATATSSGTIVYLTYGHYLDAASRVDRNPRDDAYADLEGGPQLYYVSPAGRMARRPVPELTDACLFPGQPITLRALARLESERVSRSTFEPLDPASVEVRIDGEAIAQEGEAAFFQLGADGTMVHVFPDLAPEGARRQHLEIRARTVRGERVTATLAATLRTVAKPPPVEALVGRTLAVTSMAVATPFVVPALDQVGIASIRIEVTFLAVPSAASDRFLAYAYESFDAGAAGAPPRQLRYLFEGRYREGHFILESRECYFELTCGPIPLDALRLTGAIDAGGTVLPVGLSAQYRFGARSTIAWLRDLVSSWTRGGPPPGLHPQEPGAALLAPSLWQRWAAWLSWMMRAAPLAEAAASGSPLAPWQLLDASQGFVWVGTWGVEASAPPRCQVVAHDLRRTGPTELSAVITVIPTGTAVAVPADPVIGIVVYDPATARAFWSDYSAISVRTVAADTSKTLTAELALAAAPPAGTRAVLMVDLEPVTSIVL